MIVARRTLIALLVASTALFAVGDPATLALAATEPADACHARRVGTAAPWTPPPGCGEQQVCDRRVGAARPGVGPIHCHPEWRLPLRPPSHSLASLPVPTMTVPRMARSRRGQSRGPMRGEAIRAGG